MNLKIIVTLLFMIAETGMSIGAKDKPKTVVRTTRLPKFVFGSKQTTTYTDVSVATSEVFFTCLVGTATSPCLSRRRRALTKLKKLILQDVSPITENSLESSMESPTSSHDKENQRGSRLFGVTIWTTTRTTTTITLLSTNTSTTLRYSYYCLAGNIDLPMFSCLAPGR
ncbi:UNVERIFIED_CONTAM: hypothetical protein RMT77_001696 [Armadillidium vulgare]